MSASKRVYAARRRMIRRLTQGYLRAGQHTQAEEVLSTHVAAFPTDQDALYLLMKLFIEEGCFNKARSQYEQCQRTLARYEKQPAKHLQALEAHLNTLETKTFLPTQQMLSSRREHIMEHAPAFFLWLSHHPQEESRHLLDGLMQWILETLQQTGKNDQLMESKRRETIKTLLSFAGITATPFAWWEYQKDSNSSGSHSILPPSTQQECNRKSAFVPRSADPRGGPWREQDGSRGGATRISVSRTGLSWKVIQVGGHICQ